eukprot:698501-Hanusia_phi.AAC.1
MILGSSCSVSPAITTHPKRTVKDHDSRLHNTQVLSSGPVKAMTISVTVFIRICLPSSTIGEQDIKRSHILYLVGIWKRPLLLHESPLVDSQDDQAKLTSLGQPFLYLITTDGQSVAVPLFCHVRPDG